MKKWQKITVIAASTLTLLFGVAIYASMQPPTVTASHTAQIAHVSQPTKYEVGPPDAQKILELVNAERAKVGVAPLRIDERLNQSAQVKADDMANTNYFSHIKPGETGMNGVQKGYDLTRQADGRSMCSEVSENIRWTPIDYSTSQVIYDGWYNSPPHITAIRKANYMLTGIAISKSADKYYTVEHFCIPR